MRCDEQIGEGWEFYMDYSQIDFYPSKLFEDVVTCHQLASLRAIKQYMPDCYYSALESIVDQNDDTFVTMTYIMTYCFLDPYLLFTTDRCFYNPDSFAAETNYR